MISRDERLFFEATLPKLNSLRLLDIIIVNHLLPLIEIIRNNFLHPRLRTRDYFPLKITGIITKFGCNANKPRIIRFQFELSSFGVFKMLNTLKGLSLWSSKAVVCCLQPTADWL